MYINKAHFQDLPSSEEKEGEQFENTSFQTLARGFFVAQK
jgi:hypothetical protein